MTLCQFLSTNLFKDLQYLTLCPSSLNSDNILLTVLSLQSYMSVICFNEKHLFFSIISSKYSFLCFLSRYFIFPLSFVGQPRANVIHFFTISRVAEICNFFAVDRLRLVHNDLIRVLPLCTVIR